jgi:hypothetical protein
MGTATAEPTGQPETPDPVPTVTVTATATATSVVTAEPTNDPDVSAIRDDLHDLGNALIFGLGLLILLLAVYVVGSWGQRNG